MTRKHYPADSTSNPTSLYDTKVLCTTGLLVYPALYILVNHAGGAFFIWRWLNYHHLLQHLYDLRLVSAVNTEYFVIPCFPNEPEYGWSTLTLTTCYFFGVTVVWLTWRAAQLFFVIKKFLSTDS